MNKAAHPVADALANLIERAQVFDHAETVRDQARRLQNKLAHWFAWQGARFEKLVDAHKDEWPIQEAAPVLPDWDVQFEKVGTATAAEMARVIDIAVAKALQLGAETILRQFGVSASFSLKNPRAVAYLNQYGANLVKGLNGTSKARLRTLLADGVDKGMSYGQIAKEIRAEFRDFGAKRAKLIAVTEIGNGYSQGSLAQALTLQDGGSSMEKSWMTAGDSMVEEICAGNEAEGWIPVDQAFSSGDERPLAHPRCRCSLQLRRTKA